MNLADALVNTPQDERGGEIAIRGFEYQKYWAIDELLERHKHNETYVFIPEYHDDILILDSAISPQKANFTQVKTRDSHWTLSPLIKAEKDDKLSFLGKLFKHKIDFSAYQTELSFVSNALFKFFDKFNFSGNQLSQADQDAIISAIQKQHPGFILTDLSIIKFKTFTSSINDYDSPLLGRVFKYLQHINSDNLINAGALKNTLTDLFDRKTRVSSRDIHSFDDLINKKGISNELITSIIDKLKAHKSSMPDWESISLLLSTLNKNDLEKLILKCKFELFLIKSKDTNSIQYNFYKKVKEKIEQTKINSLNISDIIDNAIICTDKCNDDFLQLLDINSKYIITCCAMILKLTDDEVLK